MSSLFNLKPPPEEKPISVHPWRNTIKDCLSHKIKHAHNSVRNPSYPKLKEKVPDTDRIKFTVIGDRVTKEFLYCVNLVKGLYKYKWKKFDVPSIRGVNSVEWEHVWNSLKVQYGGFAFCLKSRVAVLIDDKFLGGENELKELVETKYIYHLVLDYCNEAVASFASYIRCSGRPCAYMHIAINDEHIGTLIFMLFADIVPYTCENFLRLCRDTRGGYSGTPIHRIVKDGWVQGGGFGLKSTELDCENFIVPHDRRGVLCMANDGRHVDCSTQFFILLQPAPWMAHKYVAFGQLIEGEQTLKKIENVPTWYESPMSNIIIYKAGIFNMECQDIMINRGANEYIDGHIDDLTALGDLLIEALMERFWLELELKLVERLTKELLGEQEEVEDGAGNLRATQRFLRKKEEIEKQIQSQSKSTTQQNQGGKGHHRSQSAKILVPSQSNKSQVIQSTSQRSQHHPSESENNEYDVEEYEPEELGLDYKHLSLATLSLIVKPERPYYIPLTDVPYPGEVDSTYDLKKFVRGHYCLESDLQKELAKTKAVIGGQIAFPSEIFHLESNESLSQSSQSLDSEEEREVRQYLNDHIDRVSFAGGIVKSIGRGVGMLNLLQHERKSELINDEQLRKIRIATLDARAREEKKVRIAPTAHAPTPMTQRMIRRPTGYVRASDLADSDTDVPRQSVLQRLYDEVTYDDEQGPTLKDYKPFAETHPKNILLTFSPNSRIRSEEDTHERERIIRHSITVDEASFEHVLNLQHGKKVARKISSDYVKTIDQIEHKAENTLRSIEFAKTRPSMRVSEYQLKNQKYQEEMRASMALKLKEANLEFVPHDKRKKGIRLPGDTPLYSMVEVSDAQKGKMLDAEVTDTDSKIDD